jgi:enterochelin esterase family protein
MTTKIASCFSAAICFWNSGRISLIGISSGGICAFTAAWERPDAFSKVLSHVGSFTNIRGGHVYPSVIRKTERKPIRVFLQEGSNDLDNLHGNWPLANQEMAAALEAAPRPATGPTPIWSPRPSCRCPPTT